jgi:hypothetical protein
VILRERANGFDAIAGDPTPGADARQATLTLPGATRCEISRKQEYKCNFPASDARQEAVADDLATKVAVSLPKGWTQVKTIFGTAFSKPELENKGGSIQIMRFPIPVLDLGVDLVVEPSASIPSGG